MSKKFNIEHVSYRLFGCHIMLHNHDYHGSDAHLIKTFNGLKFEIFNKYKWYFRYLTALHQIRHPKRLVELREFSYQFVPTKDQETKRLKDLISGNKRILTLQLEKLEKLKSTWTQIFPIEDDERWKVAIDKVEKLRNKIASLEFQLKSIHD